MQFKGLFYDLSRRPKIKDFKHCYELSFDCICPAIDGPTWILGFDIWSIGVTWTRKCQGIGAHGLRGQNQCFVAKRCQIELLLWSTKLLLGPTKWAREEVRSDLWVNGGRGMTTFQVSADQSVVRICYEEWSIKMFLHCTHGWADEVKYLTSEVIFHYKIMRICKTSQSISYCAIGLSFTSQMPQQNCLETFCSMMPREYPSIRLSLLCESAQCKCTGSMEICGYQYWNISLQLAWIPPMLHNQKLWQHRLFETVSGQNVVYSFIFTFL